MMIFGIKYSREKVFNTNSAEVKFYQALGRVVNSITCKHINQYY